MIQRVCLVHNFYQQPGGEDTVFAAEGELLESHGVEVTRFTLHNDEIRRQTHVRSAVNTIWNAESRRALRKVLRDSGAQLVHFHNTFPLVSPAGYAAANDIGIPVVQTLHNFRLICPNALLFRNGAPCEDCVGRPVAWPGVIHACYRGSRAASATIATMTAVHRSAGTWRRRVHAFITLTDFARNLFVKGGLPPDRMFVKPNFVVKDPGQGGGVGGFALFVGRLSAEKGISVLVDTWTGLGGKIPLKVVGDGPMSDSVKALPGVEWLGHRSRTDVLQLMRDARLLIFPTLVYEGFPLVLAEAFATGLPVLASDIGASASIVRNDAGILFQRADPNALRSRLLEVWEDDARLARMRNQARHEYESNYTAERNYAMLLDVYDRASRHRAATTEL